MTLQLIIALLFSLTFIAAAEVRDWKNADASKSLKGEFVKRDDKSVTIRRKADRKTFTIPFTQLHADEIKWLNMTHPLPGQEPKVGPTTFNPSVMYEELSFGDDMNTHIDKLEKSEHVKASVPRALFGRGGINGIFKTVKPMGGMKANLYFDWNDENKLKEISIRTKPEPASSFDAKLKPCWEACIQQLTEDLGEPVGGLPDLDITSIPNKQISFTHHWKLKDGGSALVGAGHEDGQYLIIVRYTVVEQ